MQRRDGMSTQIKVTPEQLEQAAKTVKKYEIIIRIYTSRFILSN